MVLRPSLKERSNLETEKSHLECMTQVLSLRMTFICPVKAFQNYLFCSAIVLSEHEMCILYLSNCKNRFQSLLVCPVPL